MIFILFVLALVISFYGYVFVNFQKELAAIKHRKVSGAVTIPLQIPNCRDDEPEQSSTAAMEVARHDSRAPVQSQEFYQLESPYLGPLFLVPRRNAEVNRRAKAAHRRLIAAMCGTEADTASQKSAADCSAVDTDSANVIQITARVSARG